MIILRLGQVKFKVIVTRKIVNDSPPSQDAPKIGIPISNNTRGMLRAQLFLKVGQMLRSQ